MAALPVSVSAHSRVSGASASLRVAAPQRASLRCRSSQTDNGPVVAIAGATGAVGQEFLKVLDERSFPYSRLRLFASARSAGKVMRFQGQQIQVEELTEEALRGVNVALFSAGGSQSKKFARGASSAGVTVVDNSSAFRMAEGVPLVIPEVNPEAMRSVKLGRGGIVANPNCSTIIALMAATPLRRAFGAVRRMVVSTYQAASGAGQAAMDELELQTRQVLAGERPTCEIFPQQYAFNMFSHNSPLTASGYNEEELKLVHETRKIWGDDAVRITATCIRVPVMRAHGESINLEFESPVDEQEALNALRSAPGVTVLDDRPGNRFPTPLDASHQDDVLVGRVRADHSLPDRRGLNLWVCGDQIRKGAALNAVQIAELLL